MLYDVEKTEKWGVKDFVISITAFIACYLIFSLFIFGTVWFNDKNNFMEFLKANTEQLIYLQLALVLMFIIFYFYYFYENRNILKRLSRLVLIFSVILLDLVICYFIGIYVNIYARPLPLGALLILMLLGRKDAIFINIFTIILVFLTDTFTNNPATFETSAYSSIVIGYVVGMIAIYVASGIRSRLKVFLLGFLLSAPIILSFYLLEGFSVNSLKRAVVYGLTAGMSSVVLFMAILPIYERIFNVVTNYRLYEITDHSSPLIRRLIAEAPGTFNHSLVVATLAEACAVAVGVNPQLARAAAYYHDIGKLAQPEFFKENQRGANPHDELNPELSTEIIRSHAKNGAELIRKYRLPEVLADVALQHHGTLPIKYFYAKAKKMTDGELDMGNFCYAGPKPQSKLAAIIMIADASEAVTRTLADRSRESVDKQVKMIIEERMFLDQFSQCPVTVGELYTIRKTIVDNIAVVYHARINYPKFDLKPAEEENAETDKRN